MKCKQASVAQFLYLYIFFLEGGGPGALLLVLFYSIRYFSFLFYSIGYLDRAKRQ